MHNSENVFEYSFDTDFQYFSFKKFLKKTLTIPDESSFTENRNSLLYQIVQLNAVYV